MASPGALKASVAERGEILQQADPADGGGRQDGPAVGFIVERHVAGHHREIQRPAGFRNPADAADELAHDLRPFRIAEIEVVGEGERGGADRGEIAQSFRHRLLAALERVGLAIARRHVGGQRERLRPVIDAHHRGIAARALHRIAEDDVVVLLPHPAF